MKKEKLRIESDGTGGGTRIMLGDTLIDGVKSLRIDVPGRSRRVQITMEVEADIWLDAIVVRHGRMRGEIEICADCGHHVHPPSPDCPAGAKMPHDCTTCGTPLEGVALRVNDGWLCADCPPPSESPKCTPV